MIGGMAGTMVLEQITSVMYRFEKPEKRQQQEAIRKESPYDTMARRLANVLHVRLGDEDVMIFGQVLHWGCGIAWGAIYGLVRARIPALRRAAGLPFGLAFALIGDEAMNAALKLTPPPQAYPIDAHLRGFAAHVAYAAAAEGVIQTLEWLGGEAA